MSSDFIKRVAKDTPRAETFLDRLDDPEYIDSWLKSPVYHKLKKHTAATDDTSAIAELGSQVLNYSNPNYIAREIVSLHTTTMESEKIRMPSRGRAVKTSSNVTSIQASGASNEFIEVKADKEFLASEQWNRTALEDASSYIVAQQTQAVADAMSYIETKEISDFLYTLRTDSGIAGRIEKTGQNDTPNMDLLIDLWKLVKVKDRMPTAYIMSPTTYATLLKDDDLQDSHYFEGHRVDYSVGDVGMFLGSRFLVSSLIKDNFIACLDTSVTIIYLLRRDMMPLMAHNMTDDIHTFRLSTRYGLSKGLTEALAVWY